MATILTSTIIKNATDAVDKYEKTATGLAGQVDNIMTGLIGTNFSGDAATGYETFYKEKVKPAIDEHLIATNTSLMAGIKSILVSLDTQLLKQVDPQLGQNNENPGGQ